MSQWARLSAATAIAAAGLVVVVAVIQSSSADAAPASEDPFGDRSAAAGAAVGTSTAANSSSGGGCREISEPACWLTPDEAQCTASYWLYAIGVPLLLAVGTIGNALTVVVMATRTMRRTAFGTYIVAVAAADTLVLWTSLPRHFALWVWQVDIREYSEWSCRALRFLQFSLMNTSAYLLVAVTTERFLTVYFPARFRFYQTRERALRVVAGVVLFHFAWNVHIFWTLGAPPTLLPLPPVDRCPTPACSGYPSEAAATYWKDVHPWLDMCKLSLLPFVLMLSMNVAIVASLSKRSAPTAQPTAGNGGGRRVPSVICGASLFACGSAKRFKGRELSSAENSKTAMLLCVSFFYLLMTTPAFASTLLDIASRSRRATLFSSVSTVLLYVNNAANFILYSLSGATFRRLFLATFFRPPSETSHGGGGGHAVTEAADDIGDHD